MINPAAAYDALTIVEGLSNDGGRALDGEVQAICYLAFLLSLSAGEDPDFWGYGFVASDNAAPFSGALEEALSQLSLTGMLAASGGRYSSASSARVRIRAWKSLSANRRRDPYLLAAIGAARAVSLPTLVRALSLEPQLARAEALRALRPLPDEIGLPELLEDLAEVDAVLSEQGLLKSDPRRPAYLLTRAQLWLSYLSQLDSEVSQSSA
jgi:hypothetical protein